MVVKHALMCLTPALPLLHALLHRVLLLVPLLRLLVMS
jgi:hypothetical protein